MKLKTRIKRALAGFLREELLQYIGYNHKIPYMSLNDRFNVDNLSFETMVMEEWVIKTLQDLKNTSRIVSEGLPIR